MIYDRLKMIEGMEHERLSQDCVEFHSKLLKEIEKQVGIPDEFMEAMRQLDDLNEWQKCERYMDTVLLALYRYEELKLKRARQRKTISRVLFWIGLLLGIALIIL